MKKYIVSGLLMLSIIIPLVVSAQTEFDPNGPVSSCISLNNNLRYQSRDVNTNGEVSTLQDFLQAKGYLKTEPTGYFGLLTVKASQAFQAANGINGDGYVGPVTRARISAASCGGTYTTPTTTTNTDKRFKNGCSSYLGYSSTTGEPCGKTTSGNFPAGCVSAYGFSTTTGEYCDGSYQRININFTATPSTITAGQSTMLKWSTTNATSCVGNTSEISQATVGGSQTIYPNATTTYTITCSNNSGSTVAKSVTVIVKSYTSSCSDSGYDTTTGLRCGCSSTFGYSTTTGEPCGTQNSTFSVYIDANYKEVASIESAGQPVTLRWSTVGASYCNGGSWYTGNTNDSVTVYPSQTTSYSIHCVGLNGESKTKTATVKVEASSGTYREGCSSSYGWSTTTGESCGDSTPLKITTSSLPDAQVGEYYFVSLNVEGGNGSYHWSLNDNAAAFPATGLGFSQSDTQYPYSGNAILGTPATNTNGDYSFRVNVTSGSQTISKQFTLKVASNH